MEIKMEIVNIAQKCSQNLTYILNNIYIYIRIKY